MSHHDKFWEKFGQKIRQHQPDAYTDGEWASMEQLLNKAPSSSPQKKRWRLLALILVAVIGGYLAGAYYGMPSAPVEVRSFPIPIPGIAHNQYPQPVDGAAAAPQTVNRSFHPDVKSETQAADLSATAKHTHSQHTSETPASALPKASASFVDEKGTAAIAGPAANAPKPGQSQPEGSLGPLSPHRNEGRTAIPNTASRELLASFPPLSTAQPVLPLPPNSNNIAESAVSPAKQRGRIYGGVLFGANLSSLSSKGDSYSLYPFGGGFAGLRLSPRWALQAEAHFKYADNLSVAYEQTETLESNNGYSFDQVSKRSEERGFLAIEMPLLVRYQLGAKWSILAGARPALIVDEAALNLDLATQQADVSNLGQGRAGSQDKPELRQFDMGMSFALEWDFHRRWSFHTSFYRGLTDLSPNRIFQVEEKHFNTGFQASIRRKF